MRTGNEDGIERANASLFIALAGHAVFCLRRRRPFVG